MRTVSHTSTEIAGQPEAWTRAAKFAATCPGLPEPGERVAVVGCGTSWFIAQAYAVLRERAGLGITDAFAASEFPGVRDYDRVLALTRSGTTTEVLRLLADVRGAVDTTAVTGSPGTPVTASADTIALLDFADERSVVQTRFATTALALLRAHLGEDLRAAVGDARTAVRWEPGPEFVGAEQFTFLGSGWTVGLAAEAALKMCEAAGAWAESHPAMEYRHGPISIAGPGRLTWCLGPAPEGLAAQVEATGGTFVAGTLDPMAELILVQRLAVAIAESRGLNPDEPRHLTRSVVLDTP